MEHTNERDQELFAAYRRFMNELNVSHAEAVAKAVASPASRYWISPNYLYREIRKRERAEKAAKHTEKDSKSKKATTEGNDSESHSSTERSDKPRRKLTKSSVYDLLYSDYLSIRQRPTCRGLSMLAMCDLLVNRPAPSFFISTKRADECIASVKAKKNEK